MVRRLLLPWAGGFLMVCLFAGVSLAQQAGGLRGTVYDKDFEVPLRDAEILIADTGATVTSSEEGMYLFPEVAPGVYTIVFAKQGFTRQVKADVVVNAGQITELDAWLTGDFEEMEEFIVQDIQFGSATEISLLKLRLDSPSILNAISADFMSQAGQSNAADALQLVAGATVEDGKYAVIRGLPDRYVNSQMNGVRLPSADNDKRAVQLDQFSSAAIDSIQVSKTFTPDQQGDASGGAVNIALKGIPERAVLNFDAQTSFNTQSTGINDFLTYKGGGLDYLGSLHCDIPTAQIGQSWNGAVGVTRDDAPFPHKWSVSAGGKGDLGSDITIGGFSSFFYEADSTYYENGKDERWWVDKPGDPMTPQTFQGTVGGGDFKTQLLKVSQGSEEVKWGWLTSAGAETENHRLTLTHFFTHTAEDVATLAEDTQGKEYFFPGYDRYDPRSAGNQQPDAAPYLRLETLEFTERETQTLQLKGEHRIPFPEIGIDDYFKLLEPELDWVAAFSSSDLDQPDKRQFGTIWWADSYNPGFPPYVPPFTRAAVHRPYKPAADFTLGNLQRTWKSISEDSQQFFFNIKFPFEQWTEDKGYLKFGYFMDSVDREYRQESFSNFNDNSAQYVGDWEDYWSAVFPKENHPVRAGEIDADYDGKQDINAWYAMMDLPVVSKLNLIGGVRFESTEIGITNYPERQVTWIPPGSPNPVKLNPGDADVDFKQDDTLPSIGFVFRPFEKVTIRGSYAQTVARQTFKELSPLQQQDFLGGDVFIGNPELMMSSLKNWDLRLDMTPYEGGLVSVSWFYKDIKDPIEYVQKVVDFTYTTPENYPKGKLNGLEFEFRQDLGRFTDALEGLTLGGNATFIDSEVTLPDEEAAQFEQPNINAPMRTRDMTNAPDHLYNVFMTYGFGERDHHWTTLGLFYTVRGDTLIAGAGQKGGNFVPNVYEKQYGTLNMSASHKIGKHWKLSFKAKNLLDPSIETVYRSEYIGGDVTKTSYRKGLEFSLGVSAEF